MLKQKLFLTGTRYEKVCAFGTLFNPESKICDFASRVVCNSTDSSQTEDDSETDSSDEISTTKTSVTHSVSVRKYIMA